MRVKSIKNYLFSKYHNGYMNINPTLAKFRIDILNKMKKKDYSYMIFNNPLDVSITNIIGLRQLILEYMEINDKELMVNLNKLNFNGELVDYLIEKRANVLSFNLLKRYNLVQMEYDFDFDEYNIYLNLNSVGPLLIRKMGTVNIYYREALAGELDDFLFNCFQDFSEDLIIQEPLYMGLNKSLALKKFILEGLCAVSLDGVNNLILCDAYNDLIRVSSLDVSEKKWIRRSRLQSYIDKFRDNLIRSINLGYYQVCSSEIEFESYTILLNILVSRINEIKNKIKEKDYILPYNIKSYYIKEQKGSNRLKQDIGWIKREVIKKCVYNQELSSIINDVHDDIISSIFIFLLHIKLLGLNNMYYKGSVVMKYIRVITSPELRRKPILLKYIIKNAIDEELHQLKEKGMINFHQLENFFGYRVTDLIIDEVKEDYLAWFNEGLEQFSDIQYNFVKKWGSSFLESYNYKGKRIKDIMLHNILPYKDEDEILGNVLSYMHSKGAVDDEKIITTKGKMRSISKNNYFNLVESQQQYKIRHNRRNKVIIKREEYIKQRIVINSSLDTFVPLSKINKILSVLSGGTGIIYYSNSKDQKAEHYSRLNTYLSYNKYIEEKWLCMPLDYSSYDHTITLGMIKAILEVLSDTFKLPKLMQWYKQFADILKNEVIYFKELGNDPVNNQHYKYGVLSGWKITSSIESIGNAIVTYGVFQELQEKLVDYETMGDDLIIILEKLKISRDQQLKLLEKVCFKYQSLGFKMNIPKNSVGYYFLEFLRITFRPGVIQGYPSRIIGALFYVKPGKARLNFGASELLGVLNKVCKRYGVLSQKDNLAEYVTKAFLKDDVRAHFADYVKKPWNYEIMRKRKVDFIYKVDLEQCPVYKRYINIFGAKYSSIIKRIIQENMVEQARYVTKLVKKDKRAICDLERWQIQLLIGIVGNLRKKLEKTELLVLPEYHYSEILNRIVRKSHFSSFNDAIDYIQECFAKMYEFGLMRYNNMMKNIAIVKSCEDYGEIRSLLSEDKIGVEELNIPAIILSRYKLALESTIKKQLIMRVGKERDFLKGLLRQNKNMLIRRFLGIFMSIKSDLLDINSGLVVACMAD